MTTRPWLDTGIYHSVKGVVPSIANKPTNQPVDTHGVLNTKRDEYSVCSKYLWDSIGIKLYVARSVLFSRAPVLYKK